MFSNFMHSLAVFVAVSLVGCSSVPTVARKPIPAEAPHGLMRLGAIQAPSFGFKYGLETTTHMRPCTYTDYYQGKGTTRGQDVYATYTITVWTAWDKACNRTMPELMQTAPECSHNTDSVTRSQLQYGYTGWKLDSSGFFDERESPYWEVKGAGKNIRTGWGYGERVAYDSCSVELADL